MKVETIRLLFEQSGTFKRVFQSLGYKAYDYDLENEFNQTDFQLDLFNEINKAYEGKPSIFDTFNKDDLIFAFFPCTYFSVQNELIWNKSCYNFKTWSDSKVNDYIKDRKKQRELFLKILLRFIEVIKKKKLKTVIENPHDGNYLLNIKEMIKPQVIIKNRTHYGDHYKKPTMFYFYNFEPSYMSEYTINKLKEIRKISENHGIDRSLISEEFAFNFINKYIFGLR